MSEIIVGYNGQVAFDSNFVTIARKGFRARTTVGKGEKRIPLSSVTAVQLKPAGALMNGFIQFSVLGGNEGRSRFGSQSADAARDENTVMFTKGQQKSFEALRSEIEQALLARQAPANHAVTVPVAGLADQLGKLAALRDAGVLTEDEFATQKARLLA